MDQRVSFITLVVTDLDATRRFYVDGLGWEPEIHVPGEVLMFKVADKVVLSLWTESGFVADSRSGQGAVGLMQVQPDTAGFIAGLPRRPSPSPGRLEEPEVNIAYGTRFLRYLIDRYGSVDLALVAYNGGPANLGRWLQEAEARGEALRVPEDVPFAETRGFVSEVREATDIYRRAYGDRLAVPGG